MELRSYVDLDDAIRIAVKHRPKVVHKRVPVPEAVGKYSMEEIRSPVDFPRRDRSAMDGYAVRSSDTISASRINPATFQLQGSLFPSSSGDAKLGKGCAVRIMTGSPLPKGADSVVAMEEAEEESTTLRVFSPVRRYQNVSRRGEDMKKGFKIIGRGEMVTPPHVSALLECSVNIMKVCTPSIGIVPTGDEIVSGQVINSTAPFLKSYFERLGFSVREYAPVEDDKERMEKALGGVREDIILTTGGTGPGEKDLLPYVIEENGDLIFRGLKIRPGRTTSFGTFKGKPVFMISGLPVAALIASENLIFEVLVRWFGLKPLRKEVRNGILQRSVVNTLGFRSFVRVKVIEKDGVTRVIPTRVTGSGVIYSIIDADGILIVDENSEGLEEGQLVRVEMLRW